MDSNTKEEGNHNVRPFAQLILAALCLFLMLISLVLINATSFSASAHQVTKNTGLAPSDTGTPTDTPTPTPTDTPTPTPTDTPTPTPTNTPTPTPTKTPKPTPTPKPTIPATATPTLAPGVTPTATTPKPTSTAHPGTTTTSSSSNQTPTAISGVPTSSTNNGNNGGGNNNSPTTPTGGGFKLSFSQIAMSLLVLLSIVSALFVGFLVFRKRLLPSPAPVASLPPSGAQPWKRDRASSMNGITNAPNAWDSWLLNTGYAAGTPEAKPQGNAPTFSPNMGYNVQNNNAYPSPAAVPFPGNTTPPFSPPPNSGTYANNNSAFPSFPTAPNTVVSPNNNIGLPPPSTGVFPLQSLKPASALHPLPAPAKTDPSTGQVKPSPRQITKPIRLKSIQDAASQPAANNPVQQNRNSEPISEQMPSLDDPFLRDTLKHYMQRGESARQQHQNGQPGTS